MACQGDDADNSARGSTMLSHLSLRLRVSITAVVCLFAGLTVVAGVIAWQSRSSVRAEAMENARTLAWAQAAEVTAMFNIPPWPMSTAYGMPWSA